MPEVTLESLATRRALARAYSVPRSSPSSRGDNRRWQFVYIFAGAAATFLVSVIAQLVLVPLVKK